MKELVKTSRVTGYIEKMYRQLNIDYFDGKLVEPIITVMDTKGSYGHVTCSKIWKVKNIERYELNIAAGTLSRPIESVVSTLLHEMVHIYCLMNNIQDTSRGTTYHNKRFKEQAEKVGLVIDYDKRIGWSITTPSEPLIEYIITQGWSEILMNRGGQIHVTPVSGGSTSPDQNEKDPPKKPSSTRKYICPRCSTSVRATRTVAIKCIPCDTQMIVEE